MNKLLVFIAAIIVTGYVHAANDRAFAWQVDSHSATVYLVGSIHFADRSFYPLRAEIENAFTRSQTLVVELDMNSINTDDYNRLLQQEGVYRDGTTVKDVISEQTWVKLQQHLLQLGIDYEAVKYYRPGVLVLTLAAMQATHLGLETQFGIDAHFLQRAQQQSKTVSALETLEQQFRLFLTVPDGDLLLQESLHSLDESGEVMDDMVRLWKQGDEAGMSQLVFEDSINEFPAFAEIYEVLLFNRNRQMAAKLDAMLKQKKAGDITPEKASYFVVVGAGHLIGEQGIVSLLRAKGYEVRRF